MFDIQNILLSVTAVSNIGLVLFVYLKEKKQEINILFALFAIFLSFWALALLQFRIAESDIYALYLLKISYIAALLIGVTFYFFSIAFPNNERPGKIHRGIIFVLTSSFIGLILLPTFLTKGVLHHSWGREVTLGIPEFLFFAGLFSFLFIGGLLRIWYKVFRSKGVVRWQLFAIAASVSVAGILGMYFNLVLPSPFLQNFKYVWTGPLFTFLIAMTITYSIFRFKLFNAKTIITEVVTFVLWLLLLIQFLLSTSATGFLVNGGLFASSVVIGLLLIRSVQAEVKAREDVQRLATDLEKANERLRELDRQKTEFVSIASHQLRSPLTAIKGYASLLLEGSFGKLPVKAKDAVERIFDSSRFMALSIEDFLNVSRIELGTIKYDMKEMDLFMLAKEIVREMLPGAKEKGLTLTISGTTTEPCKILGDHGKLRQVVLNLVDNAMKYTPKGHIAVSVIPDTATATARMVIADTGVGIPKDVIPKLFQKFSRADNANEVNVMGTGLGLYVAKEFVEAHNGTIWAESEGQGKGSRFIVEFPMRRS